MLSKMIVTNYCLKKQKEIIEKKLQWIEDMKTVSMEFKDFYEIIMEKAKEENSNVIFISEKELFSTILFLKNLKDKDDALVDDFIDVFTNDFDEYCDEERKEICREIFEEDYDKIIKNLTEVEMKKNLTIKPADDEFEIIPIFQKAEYIKEKGLFLKINNYIFEEHIKR